jgi:hypothetical protein
MHLVADLHLWLRKCKPGKKAWYQLFLIPYQDFQISYYFDRAKGVHDLVTISQNFASLSLKRWINKLECLSLALPACYLRVRQTAYPKGQPEKAC